MRPLARLLEVAPRLSCEESGDSIQFYNSLIQVTEKVIHRELSHIEWWHEQIIDNAPMAYGVNRAHELGYLSDVESDGTRIATPDDVRRALSNTELEVLASLAQLLGVKLPPDIAAAMEEPAPVAS